KGDRTYRTWRSRGVPAPRPLYRLPQLLASPEKPVIITEGEKKGDAAVALFSDHVATTTIGGSKAPQKSDFAPLAGRDLVIWPDNDEPGRDFANVVTKLARDAGAKSVRIVAVPETFPPKWDLADDLPDGITVDDLRRLLDSAPTAHEGEAKAERQDG